MGTPIRSSLTLEVQLLEYVVGSEEITKVQPLAKNEMLMLNAGTARTSGVITEIKGTIAHIKLSRKIVARIGSTVAISRRISQRFRLIGVGKIVDDK